MKILHLLDIPWWSGLSAYAFDCMDAHQKIGHTVIFACEINSLPFKKASGKTWTIAPIRGRGNLSGLVNFFAVGSILSRENPDWVVAHTGSTHWIAWLWSKFKKIRVVRTRATSQKLKRSGINRKIYSETAKIVAASDHLRKECADFIGNGTGRAAVLYPPAQAPLQRSENVQNQSLGILARLDPVKGHGDLLRAFKIVQMTFPRAELHLAGPEENLRWSDLLRQIKALDLKNVVYHGFLPREKIWDFIKHCSVGIVSSIASEEVSRALLEWMAQGKPVVATRVGCIPEILGHDGGFIVPIGEAAQMAEKMKSLLTDPALCKRMGDHNRSLCANRFSMDRFCEDWKAVLAS